MIDSPIESKLPPRLPPKVLSHPRTKVGPRKFLASEFKVGSSNSLATGAELLELHPAVKNPTISIHTIKNNPVTLVLLIMSAP
jgi:hypothetical protein